METVAALFSAIARSLRGLFDLASMAAGIAPTSVALADAVCMPSDASSGADPRYVGLSRTDSPMRDQMDFVINPATGLAMPCGQGGFDIAGNTFGTSGDDHF